MTEAAQARAAAMPVEVKKDSLSQLQNGDWKLTLKVAAQDMPAAMLEALPGTRYQTAFVEVADNEEPINRKEPTPGDKAKRHFEAMCQDWDFTEWLVERNPALRGGNNSNREMVKRVLGIQSANELLADPAPWDKLYNEYKYKDNNQ